MDERAGICCGQHSHVRVGNGQSQSGVIFVGGVVDFGKDRRQGVKQLNGWLLHGSRQTGNVSAGSATFAHESLIVARKLNDFQSLHLRSSIERRDAPDLPASAVVSVEAVGDWDEF